VEYAEEELFVVSRGEWLVVEEKLQLEEEKLEAVEVEEEEGERKLQCHPKKLLTKKWIHSWSSDKKIIEVAQNYINIVPKVASS